MENSGGEAVHELGIVMKILDVAMAALPAEMGDVRVGALNLRIGKLAAVIPESLRFCFSVAAQHSPLAGAKLNIEEIPIVAECRDCGATMIIDLPHFVCEQCNGGNLHLVSGRELTVTSLELADLCFSLPEKNIAFRTT